MLNIKMDVSGKLGSEFVEAQIIFPEEHTGDIRVGIPNTSPSKDSKTILIRCDKEKIIKVQEWKTKAGKGLKRKSKRNPTNFESIFIDALFREIEENVGRGKERIN
ncbi:hypothetical protein ACFL15_02180 [Patescibacteria group bacterium]